MDDSLRLARGRSFSGVAADYARARPGYPARAVDWLLPDTPSDVLELGAAYPAGVDRLPAAAAIGRALDPGNVATGEQHVGAGRIDRHHVLEASAAGTGRAERQRCRASR